MKLDAAYSKLIVGDFYQNLLSGFGISRAKVKTVDAVVLKKCLVTTLQQHIGFHRDTKVEFTAFFRKVLRKEYKLAGIETS